MIHCGCVARFVLLSVPAVALGCASTPPRDAGSTSASAGAGLVGAWRARVQFSSGDFAPIRDLEFLYAFSGTPDGGTLIESSNYDASPPVPPAYGVWQRSGPDRFDARYTFFTTKPPASLDSLTKGAGWGPAGRGELTEQIVLAPDGRSFSSKLHLRLFDAAGQPASGGGDAAGSAERLTIEP